jgi:hypothetical protein
MMPWSDRTRDHSGPRFYTLHWKTNLSLTNWLILEGQGRVRGEGGVRPLSDSNLDRLRHYRVRGEP